MNLLSLNEIFRTLGSGALLMNVNNGEILSLVSLPDFNINKRGEITDRNILTESLKVFMS